VIPAGRNPLCIVVPCHRVIGASGDLTGYAGGLADTPGDQRFRLTGRPVVAIG